MKNIVDKSVLGKAWAVAVCPEEDETLCQVDNLLQRILARRGITDMAAMEKFLNPCLKDYMPNPSFLLDIDKAAKIIADSI